MRIELCDFVRGETRLPPSPPRSRSCSFLFHRQSLLPFKSILFARGLFISELGNAASLRLPNPPRRRRNGGSDPLPLVPLVAFPQPTNFVWIAEIMSDSTVQVVPIELRLEILQIVAARRELEDEQKLASFSRRTSCYVRYQRRGEDEEGGREGEEER
ncbi:hypothetical protein BDY24DRAFT_183964 [Mrakia frigida]|uniref:uncharacterized protein n=1 Tax=Mrakia frigida TaxID=29902 RepID=UPI003FCBF086